jgi:hypothetical protein
MAHRRNGYSRLELGIACVTAAILAGLCVPAVQKLRAASDRTRCANNLRMLHAGIRSYHDAKSHLPRGGDQADGSRFAGVSHGCREREWSWAYHILPHLGFGEIHAYPEADAVRAAEVPPFYCGSRRSAGRRWNDRTMLDYAANAGTLPSGADGAIQRSTSTPNSWRDFVDGLGSTLLLAEKRVNVAKFGDSPGDTHGFATPGWTDDCEAHRFGRLPPAADLDDANHSEAFTEFGSSHPGVVVALFADGTVRSVRFSVSPAVWRRVSVRNDHQNFNLDDLQ